jgi:hypothetical protein
VKNVGAALVAAHGIENKWNHQDISIKKEKLYS